MDTPHTSRERLLAPGEVLFRQGDPPGPLYVLASGSVSIVEDGVQVAEVGEPGTWVGEISRLLDIPRAADIVALTECVLEEIEDVDAYFRTDTDRAVELARLLARRLVDMDRKFVDARRALLQSGQRMAGDEQFLPPELDPVRRYLRAIKMGT